MAIESLPCLWKFDINDQTTWPYVSYVLIGKGDKKTIKWLKNPFFKYGHLIKGYLDAASERIKSKVEERLQSEHQD